MSFSQEGVVCSKTLCVLLYSVTQESEQFRTGSSGLIVEKVKHVQLLLNFFLSFELKFPTTSQDRDTAVQSLQHTEIARLLSYSKVGSATTVLYKGLWD